MKKIEGKVGDVFSVFTETSTDTLCLTPKKEFNKNLIVNPEIFRGEIRLSHVENGGTLYLGISKHATCTTVKDCSVVFHYNGELPDIEGLTVE